MNDAPQSPMVLVCQTCGRQRELPAPGDPSLLRADGWLRCSCKSTVFSLRMREMPRVGEPAP